MTPREKLIENIIDIVHATHGTPNDEKMAHFVKLLAATLKTHYAIGKWVPVSERLPKFGDYIARNEDGDEFHCTYRPHYPKSERWVCYSNGDETYRDVVSWLELDIPEVES